MKKESSSGARKKSRVVAVKIDAEMATFLENLPNTSEYIRRAILARSSLDCPLCGGTGTVCRGVGEHFLETSREAQAAGLADQPTDTASGSSESNASD